MLARRALVLVVRRVRRGALHRQVLVDDGLKLRPRHHLRLGHRRRRGRRRRVVIVLRRAGARQRGEDAVAVFPRRGFLLSRRDAPLDRGAEAVAGGEGYSPGDGGAGGDGVDGAVARRGDAGDALRAALADRADHRGVARGAAADAAAEDVALGGREATGGRGQRAFFFFGGGGEKTSFALHGPFGRSVDAFGVSARANSESGSGFGASPTGYYLPPISPTGRADAAAANGARGARDPGFGGASRARGGRRAGPGARAGARGREARRARRTFGHTSGGPKYLDIASRPPQSLAWYRVPQAPHCRARDWFPRAKLPPHLWHVPMFVRPPPSRERFIVPGGAPTSRAPKGLVNKIATTARLFGYERTRILMNTGALVSTICVLARENVRHRPLCVYV